MQTNVHVARSAIPSHIYDGSPESRIIYTVLPPGGETRSCARLCQMGQADGCVFCTCVVLCWMWKAPFVLRLSGCLVRFSRSVASFLSPRPFLPKAAPFLTLPFLSFPSPLAPCTLPAYIPPEHLLCDGRRLLDVLARGGRRNAAARARRGRIPHRRTEGRGRRRGCAHAGQGARVADVIGAEGALARSRRGERYAELAQAHRGHDELGGHRKRSSSFEAFVVGCHRRSNVEAAVKSTSASSKTVVRVPVTTATPCTPRLA